MKYGKARGTRFQDFPAGIEGADYRQVFLADRVAVAEPDQGKAHHQYGAQHGYPADADQ